MTTRLILLARAYNDVDCRLPLLLEFAKDKNYKVEIIGIPSNSGIQDPRRHELRAVMGDNDIHVSTVYERAMNKPFLKTAYRLYNFVDNLFHGTLSNRVTERLKSWIFKIVLLLSIRRKEWISYILRDFQSSIVLLDEIAFHKGRSFFVDELLENRKHGGYSIYLFLTGQDPYLNQTPECRRHELSEPKHRIGIPLFVPGPNDKIVMQRQLPLEAMEVVGNTRFDLSWVRTRSHLASRRILEMPILKQPVKYKIAFMLSKLEYGVDLDNIVEAINACATIGNSLVIAKPHTRGMSIGSLGDRLDTRVIDGVGLSSSEIIEWADIVLFTGSTIAFQAMQLGKKVIYLKYCQRYESIFDEENALYITRNKDEVLSIIESKASGHVVTEAVERFLAVHVYNGVTSGEVCRVVKEKIEKIEKPKRNFARASSPDSHGCSASLT